jgi:hypothetical protein
MDEEEGEPPNSMAMCTYSNVFLKVDYVSINMYGKV